MTLFATAERTTVTNQRTLKVRRTATTNLVLGAIIASSAAVVSVPAPANAVRPIEIRFTHKERSDSETLIKLQAYNDPVAEKERAAVDKMKNKGATYARLAELYNERNTLAAELELPVVGYEVFEHAENILDSIDKTFIDHIRIGLSPLGGLELRSRHNGELFVAAISSYTTELERHKGRGHKKVGRGAIADATIARFLESKE